MLQNIIALLPTALFALFTVDIIGYLAKCWIFIKAGKHINVQISMQMLKDVLIFKY